MADSNYTISSFLSGEWSQTAQGGIADPKYKMAMNVCLNGFPTETGAWVRRSGTQFCAPTRGGLAGRLIAFTFQEDAPYNMEFTDGYLRFFNGANLVMTNDSQAVVSISAANPAKVATTTAHGWTTGNRGTFNSLGTNNPQLQNRYFTITVTSATEFTLADAITGANIDGGSIGSFVSGNFTRVLEVTTSYSGGMWKDLRVVQAEINAVFLHPLVAPQMLSVTSAPTNAAFATFQLVPAQFKDGPYLDPVTGGAQLTPSAVSGSINLVLSVPAYSNTTVYTIGDMVLSSSISYKSLVDLNLNNTPASNPTKWQVVDPTTAVGPKGFQSTDVGRHIRLASEPALWASGSTYAAGTAVTYNNAYYTSLTSSNTGHIPGSDIVNWAINPSALVWTWGKITGLLNLIASNPGGSSNIGDMTLNGGLAAAFDGNSSQSASASAAKTATAGPFSPLGLTSYVGKNFGVSNKQTILSATLVPTTDQGIALLSFTAFLGAGGNTGLLTINLRAKNSAPANSADGTLLGTFSGTYPDLSEANIPGAVLANALQTSAVTILSNDNSTQWQYIWFEIILATAATGVTITGFNYAAEVQYVSPSSSGSSAGVTADIYGQALPATSAIRTWRMGLLSSSSGYPTCGTYHEGRIWLSGSVGNRIDGSVPITVDPMGIIQSISFEPTKPDGTVTDSNAIDYTFDAQEVNKIFHMTPDQQGIIVGTQSGEWLVQASALNSPLSPTNIQAHRVTRIGCANVEPRRAEHTLLLVQKFSRKIVEYFADIFSGKFTAPNLSEKAKHLTGSGIAEIAYQQELTPIMWARMNDGTLKGMTYKRDTLMTSQGPTFNGWHRHELGSDHIVESICVGPNHDGTLDSLAIIANDPSSDNLRHVEILMDQFEETDGLTDGWFLDSATIPSSYTTDASNVTFNGLWYKNGESVTVVAGGLDLGEYTVSNGSVVVPFNTSNALFTTSFVSSYNGAMPALVGDTFTSQGQLVRAVTQPESGARLGPALGKYARHDLIAALVKNTQGISFGTDFTRLNPAKLETPGGTPYTPLQLFSGIIRHPLTDKSGPGTDSMVCWQITRPFPAIIAAITGFLRTEDQ